MFFYQLELRICFLILSCITSFAALHYSSLWIDNIVLARLKEYPCQKSPPPTPPTAAATTTEWKGWRSFIQVHNLATNLWSFSIKLCVPVDCCLRCSSLIVYDNRLKSTVRSKPLSYVLFVYSRISLRTTDTLSLEPFGLLRNISEYRCNAH